MQSPWGSTSLEPAFQKDDDKASTPAEVALELRICAQESTWKSNEQLLGPALLIITFTEFKGHFAWVDFDP